MRTQKSDSLDMLDMDPVMVVCAERVWHSKEGHSIMARRFPPNSGLPDRA